MPMAMAMALRPEPMRAACLAQLLQLLRSVHVAPSRGNAGVVTTLGELSLGTGARRWAVSRQPAAPLRRRLVRGLAVASIDRCPHW